MEKNSTSLPRIGKFTTTGSRTGLGMGEEQLLLEGTGFLLGFDEDILGVESRDADTALWMS